MPGFSPLKGLCLGISLMGFPLLKTTPLLGFSPLEISPSAAEISPTWKRLWTTTLQDFPHSEVQIATSLLVFSPLEVEVSNMSMGATPLKILTLVTASLMGFLPLESVGEPDYASMISPTWMTNSAVGIFPTQRSRSPLCCWDFSHSK